MERGGKKKVAEMRPISEIFPKFASLKRDFT
jgi:hypothetical protein